MGKPFGNGGDPLVTFTWGCTTPYRALKPVKGPDQACLTHAQGGQGSLAVRTEGSGALDAVRVINLLRGTVFWFRVDSAVPGLPAAVLAWQQRGGQQQGAVKQEVGADVALACIWALFATHTVLFCQSIRCLSEA